jgi:hypothetical protein
MAIFDRCTFAGQLALMEICDVGVTYARVIASDAQGGMTRKSSSSTSLQR